MFKSYSTQITEKRVLTLDQRKFERARPLKKSFLEEVEVEQDLNLRGTQQSLDRKKTSKGREVAKSMPNSLKFSSPLKSARDSQELVPFTGPPSPSERQVSRTYLPVYAYSFLGSSFSANLCGSTTSFCCWRALSLSTSCTP